MTDTNERATIGGNNPPLDPVDEAIAPFAASIEMAENTLVGMTVENDVQEADVTSLLKDIKAASKDLNAARLEITRPMDEAKKAVMAKFKPTETDLKRIADQLVAMMAPYKKAKAERIAAEQAEAQRKADEAMKAAQEARAASNPTDLDERREADAAAKEAERLAKDAKKAAKAKVGGMRTVHKYEITDHRAALHDIAKNDKEAMTAFIEEYVRRNHRLRSIDGVKVWTEKEAF